MTASRAAAGAPVAARTSGMRRLAAGRAPGGFSDISPAAFPMRKRFISELRVLLACTCSTAFPFTPVKKSNGCSHAGPPIAITWRFACAFYRTANRRFRSPTGCKKTAGNGSSRTWW